MSENTSKLVFDTESNMYLFLDENQVKKQHSYLKMGEVAYLFNPQEVKQMDERLIETKVKQPDFPKVFPKDKNQLVLVYGILIPQWNLRVKDCKKYLKNNSCETLACLENKKLYISELVDFLFFRMSKYVTACALLLRTSIDFSKKKPYGFGYTNFVRNEELKIYDNMFRRPFIFSLRDIEETFQLENSDNWEEYIDIPKLIQTADDLYDINF